MCVAPGPAIEITVYVKDTEEKKRKMHEMSVMLHEQGRDDATPLNFKKFGDQKYLFYVIICIVKCMIIL